MQISVKGGDERARAYVKKRAMTLEKHMPKRCRAHADVAVLLNDTSCEMTCTLPNDQYVIKETALNHLIATDIVTAAIANKLQQYSRQYGGGTLYYRLRARLVRI